MEWRLSTKAPAVPKTPCTILRQFEIYLDNFEVPLRQLLDNFELIDDPETVLGSRLAEPTQGWAMFTFLSAAMFLAMRFLPILNDAMFRRCLGDVLTKTLPYDILADVLM